MRIRYYENEKTIKSTKNILWKKNRDVLFAKFKLKQQNRNYERKVYKEQVEELNKKLEDLTQAFEMLKTPNS